MAPRSLDPQELLGTAERLQDRVIERFPDANLGRFSGEIVSVVRKAELRTAWIRRPLVPLRVAVCLLIAAGAMLVGLGMSGAQVRLSGKDFGEIAQGIEATLSALTLMGAAAFFLVTIETRVKRRRALRAIRELRVLAHIVDMHQLVKDPKDPRLTGTDTASSPVHRMTPYELYRYLDYCSEMLAILSKIAQLYVDDLDDSVVLAHVDGLERLVQGLSDKIWRKLSMVDRMIGEAS